VNRAGRGAAFGMLAVLCFGCERTARQSQAVQVAVSDAIRGIKPGYSLVIGEGVVGGMVFESLAERDSNANAIPWLAKRWVSVDSQTWTFTLHSGVKFHDGTALTARDVVRSWTALVADSVDGDEPPGSFMLVRGAAEVRARRAGAISGLQVIDDTTLRIALIQREPGLPRTLGSRRLGVSAASSAPWAPVGTGPWRFARGRLGDSTLHFVRSPLYWNERAANESLMVRVVAQESLPALFDAGLIDCALDLGPGTAAALAASRSVRLIAEPALTRSRVLINFLNPALRDIRVRRALLLALDRRRLSQSATSGNTVVSDAFVPPAISGADSVPLTPYRPDSARRLLAAAGFTESHPLRLRTPRMPAEQMLTSTERVLIEFWRSVGIQIEENGANGYASIDAQPQSDLEFWNELPGITTPEEYLNTVGVEGPFALADARTQWMNKAFRDLYAVARSTRDSASRAVALHSMMAMAHDSLPSLPLFFYGTTNAASLRVSGCSEQMPRYGSSALKP
jgi:peptide/nickel transport system substrate-binding protein